MNSAGLIFPTEWRLFCLKKFDEIEQLRLGMAGGFEAPPDLELEG